MAVVHFQMLFVAVIVSTLNRTYETVLTDMINKMIQITSTTLKLSISLQTFIVVQVDILVIHPLAHVVSEGGVAVPNLTSK